MYYIELQNFLTSVPANEKFINGLLLNIISYRVRLCQISPLGSLLTPWMLMNASDTGELRWFATIGVSIERLEDVRHFFLSYGTHQPEVFDEGDDYGQDTIYGTLRYITDMHTHHLQYSITKPQLPFSVTIYYEGNSSIDFPEIKDRIFELTRDS